MRKLLAILFALWAIPAQATVTCSVPFNLQNGQTADATQVMANYNALIACFTSAASAGVNSDITSLTGLTTPLPYASGGSTIYIGGTSTGTANAQVVGTLTPTGFSLTRGFRTIFTAGFSNTGATTFAIGGTAATNVYRMSPSGPQALTGGEIASGNIVEAVYDGTQYELVSVHAQFGGFGPLTALTSATTTDLGTVPSHLAQVTGAATITSFGSSASVTFPVYKIIFTGTATLTHNATSLILPGAANIITAANDAATAVYLGSGNWQVTNYQPASGTSVVAATPLCGAIGLRITNNSGTPNTNVDITADNAVMVTSAGASKYATSVSVTINTTNTGVINGIQAARGASTWYNIYLLSNGTTTGGFAVDSSSALSAPSGYTYSCRLGAMRTDGAGNFRRTLQVGSWTQYTTAYQTMGSTSSAAWQTIATGSYVPTTATEIGIIINSDSGAAGGTLAAPNTNGASNTFSTTTPAPCGTLGNGASPGGAAPVICRFVLESSNVFLSSQSGTATSYMFAMGWKDKVNAN